MRPSGEEGMDCDSASVLESVRDRERDREEVVRRVIQHERILSDEGS